MTRTYRRVDLSDTPYEGTLTLPRNMPQGGRRARGKYRGNAARLPSWIPDETLEVLKFGTRTKRPRYATVEGRRVEAAPARTPETARISRDARDLHYT